MLELKSKNLFIKSHGSHSVISKILDFYDLIGKNILLLHYKGSSMSSWAKFNKQEFSVSSLGDILSNHLFRLDLIVIDTNNQNVEDSYQTIRQITDLPVIFLVDIKSDNLDLKNPKGKIKIKNFDTAFILSKSDEINNTLASIYSWQLSDSLDNFIVECLSENWKSNLKELKTQYVRDKNLRDILGDDE